MNLRLFKDSPGLGVFVFGGLLSAVLSAATWRLEREQRQYAFNDTAQLHQAHFQQQFERLADVLHAIAQDLAYAPTLDGEHFRLSTETLKQRLGNGIRALAWVPVLRPDQRANWRQLMQVPVAGFGQEPAFIWQGESEARIPVLERAQYFPITFISIANPAGNRYLLGFDLGSEPVRLQALQAAQQTGQLQVSAPIILQGSAPDQRGFLVLVPIHRRSDQSSGFIIAAVEARAWFEHALAALPKTGIDTRWWDAHAPEPALYRHQARTDSADPAAETPAATPADSQPQARFVVHTGTRQWQFQMTPSPAYLAEHGSWYWLLVLVSGLLLSLGLALISFSVRQRLTLARRYGHQQAQLAGLAQHELLFIANQIPTLIWQGRRSGLCTSVNAAWPALLGVSADSLLGYGWLTHVHPEDRDALTGAMARCGASQTHADQFRSEFSLRLQSSDEQYCSGWCSVSLLSTSEPAPTDANGPSEAKLVLVFTDLSVQQKAQAERELVTAQFQKIFDAEPECVKILDADGGVLAMNTAGFDLLELTPQERTAAIGQTLERYIRADYRDQFNSLIQRLQHEAKVELEFPLTSAKGTPRWMESHGVRMPDDGQQARYLFITRDISQRKHNEQLWQAMVETSAQATLVCTLDGCIVLANQRFEQISGYDRADLHGQSLALLLPANAQAAYRDWFLQTLESTTHAPAQRLYLQQKNGLSVEAELCISAVPTERSQNMVCSFSLLSELNQHENERLQRTRQLEQAHKMEAIGQLTSGIAHDFNNILASILGYSQLAQQRCVTDEGSPLARYLAQIIKSGIRARDLIAKLMTYARSNEQDAGKLQSIQVQAVVDEVLALLRPTLPASISLERDPLVEPLSMFGSVTDLHQILMNLIINARDACTGVGQINIHLRAAEPVDGHCASCLQAIDGRYASITVEDNGEGIDADAVRRIFDPFFTTKSLEQGTGMGLALVHGLAHKMGAHLQIQSRRGQGASFRLLFPQAFGASDHDALPAAALTPLRAAPSAGARGASDFVAAPRHLLLVDDDVAITDALSDYLRGHGFKVSVFNDSQQALGQCLKADQHYDLIICDQSMPGVTGLQLARAALECQPQRPVLLCTGNIQWLDVHLAQALGVADILRKPILLADWLVHIEHALTKKNVTEPTLSSAPV